MKKLLFLILLTFAACLDLPLFKCDEDDLFESDVAGVLFNNGTINQYFIERTCNGKQIKKSVDVYYCSNNYLENQYEEFKKKSKRLGEECWVDAECWDETVYYRSSKSVNGVLKCIDNVCKLPIECGKNQFFYQTNNKTKPYACKDYEELNKPFNLTTDDKISCPPGSVQEGFSKFDYNKWEAGPIKKCIKRYSLPDGTILPSYAKAAGLVREKEVCQSGFMVFNQSNYSYFCNSPVSEEECKKNEKGEWKYRLNFTNFEEEYFLNKEYDCEQLGEYRYVENSAYTMARYKYFKNYVVDAYNNIDFEKILEEGIDVERNEEYKEYLKKLEIYNNFNELYGQEIIDENGEPVKGKKKCLDFLIQQSYYSTSIASILKMSISIALLLLLV